MLHSHTHGHRTLHGGRVYDYDNIQHFHKCTNRKQGKEGNSNVHFFRYNKR